jgi:hypothetical protein
VVSVREGAQVSDRSPQPQPHDLIGVRERDQHGALLPVTDVEPFRVIWAKSPLIPAAWLPVSYIRELRGSRFASVVAGGSAQGAVAQLVRAGDS